MTTSLRHSAGSIGFGAARQRPSRARPPVGNLFHAVVCDHGGASASTLSGSGWTLHEQEVVAQSNGSSRFFMAVWEKVAGASEPTTITATLTGGGDCGILLCEWESDSGETFTYDTSTSANTSNAGAITSQATGTPGSATGTKTTTASGAGTDRSTASAIVVHTLGRGGGQSLAVPTDTETDAAVAVGRRKQSRRPSTPRPKPRWSWAGGSAGPSRRHRDRRHAGGGPEEVEERRPAG